MTDLIFQYAPLIIVVVIFLTERHVFVTPTQLSQVKEEILETVKQEYATKEISEAIKEDIKEIKEELRTISEFIFSKLK